MSAEAEIDRDLCPSCGRGPEAAHEQRLVELTDRWEAQANRCKGIVAKHLRNSISEAEKEMWRRKYESIRELEGCTVELRAILNEGEKP